MGLGLGACRVLVPLALFGLVTENAEAQTCTIGKRCGNTCISALDTCHLNGDGSGLSDEAIVAVSVAAGVALVGLIVWWRLASSEFLYPGEAVAAKGLQPDGRIVVRSSTKGLIVVTNTLRGGLDPGDQLVAIDNIPIQYFDDVVKAQERPPVFREGYRVRVRTRYGRLSDLVLTPPQLAAISLEEAATITPPVSVGVYVSDAVGLAGVLSIHW